MSEGKIDSELVTSEFEYSRQRVLISSAFLIVGLYYSDRYLFTNILEENVPVVLISKVRTLLEIRYE